MYLWTYWHRLFLPPPPMGISGVFRLLCPTLYRGHSHSPPLTRHYVSYMISTFVETMPVHMAPIREFTFFYYQSCHKSMWANDFMISDTSKLADTFSDTSRNFFPKTSGCVVGENVVWVSNSLDPDEMPSYSVSHPDPICLHIAPWSCLAD